MAELASAADKGRLGGSAPARFGSKILLAVALLLGLASLVIIEGRGLPGRFPGEVASVAAFYDYRDTKPFREGRCFITSKDRPSDYDRATCLRIDDHRRNVLLLGDSHAAHLWTALRDTWTDTNFLQATASGCKPVLGTTGAGRCTAMMMEILRTFVPAHRLDGLILAGYWEPGDLAPLQATIAYLTPLVGKVTVFGPMPRYDEPVATLLARAMLNGDLTTMPAHETPEVPGLDARMAAGTVAPVTYVSLYRTMCLAGRCRLFASPGVPMQFDYHHLTQEGAAVLMSTLRGAGMGSP